MSSEDSIQPDASTVYRHQAGDPRQSDGQADIAKTGPTEPPTSKSVHSGPSSPEIPDSASLAANADQREIAEAQTVIRGSSRAVSSSPVADPVDRSPASVAKVLLGQRLNHFLLEEMIGGGGMGAVFRAHDEQLDRIVAIKVIPFVGEDPDLQRRFRNESQSAAKLDHPRIAKVFDAGSHGQWHYIVFEYVEGTNIRDWVHQHGMLSIDEAVFYTAQLADALQHASERGIVHRDIKPSNVLIAGDGKIKLVDMGLARSEGLDLSEDMTASGVTLGTFDYISPEQAHDPRDADLRSDLYSLGCTLYFMLTGSPPYPGGTMLQKLLSHGNAPPPDPRTARPEISGHLVSVMQKMLAKKPADRYQNANDLMADLHVVADRDGLSRAQSVDVAAASTPSVLVGWLERNLPWLAAVSLLLAIAGWLHLESAASREELVIPPTASRPIQVDSPAGDSMLAPGATNDPSAGVPDADRAPSLDSSNSSAVSATMGISASETTSEPTESTSTARRTSQPGDAVRGSTSGEVSGASDGDARFGPADGPPRLTDFPIPSNLLGGEMQRSEVLDEGANGRDSLELSFPPASLPPGELPMVPNVSIPSAIPNASLPLATLPQSALPQSTIPKTVAGQPSVSDMVMRPPPGSGAIGSDRDPSESSIAAAASRANGKASLSNLIDGEIGPAMDAVPPRLIRIVGSPMPSEVTRDADGAALAPTLSRALELAARYEVSRIEIGVPILYSAPVQVTVDNLRITSSVGGGSTIVFESGDLVTMERSKMISLGSHPIEFNDLHFVWNVPRDEIDGGAMFHLNDNRSIELTDCSVTINNPGLREEVYAFDVVTDPDKLPRERREAARGDVFPLVDVKLYNVILRGQMTMLNMDYAAKLWLDWDNGMLAITERMIDMAGARAAPPLTSGSIKLSMTRVTAHVPRGVLRTRLGVSGSYPVPISRLARKCVFVVDPTASHFEVTGLRSLATEGTFLRLEGSSNAYAVEPMMAEAMLRSTAVDGQSQTTRMSDLANSPPSWADENRPQWSVIWDSVRLTDGPTSKRRPSDYRQAKSVSMAGFDEKSLPTIPAIEAVSAADRADGGRVAERRIQEER